MSEIYYSGDNARQMFAKEDQPQSLYDELRAVFPWVNPEMYVSITQPTFHEVLQENVLTCNLPFQSIEFFAGKSACIGARKFCMESQTSYIRVYELYDGEHPAWLPASGKILMVGTNRKEFGRPCPDNVTEMVDYYFGGDSDEIEAAFGLPNRRGDYATWYGATVVNGEVKRVKQYLYSEQNGFSDWDVIYLMHCKRLQRNDLMGLEPPTAQPGEDGI